MKALWHGTVLADSAQTIVVEGNHYFPPDSVHLEFFEPTETHSTCPWKGEASYYDIVVGDKRNEDAAWYYPHPKEAAEKIAGYIAFWRGVEVME